MNELDKSFQYLSFFNLREPPYSLVPVSHIFFPAKKQLQILDIIKFSILQGSLITVIVGEPGVGKTQVLLTLLSSLPQDSFQRIEILNPALTPDELIKSIFYQLKLENNIDSINQDLVLRELRERLTEMKKKQGKILLIIDEAQLLPDDTLEKLRLLTNLNQGTDPILQIILVGQPALKAKLSEEKFLPLRQRISVFEELKPLEKDELIPYIWFRINQVSENAEINFKENILRLLYKWTKGNPRLVNKLMDRTLFVAYSKQERLITKKHLKEAKATFEALLL